MKATNFRGQNIVFGQSQLGEARVPAYKTEPQGQTTTCWKMSIIERIRALFTGRVYVTTLTFGLPHPPLLISTTFEPEPPAGYVCGNCRRPSNEHRAPDFKCPEIG